MSGRPSLISAESRSQFLQAVQRVGEDYQRRYEAAAVQLGKELAQTYRNFARATGRRHD